MEFEIFTMKYIKKDNKSKIRIFGKNFIANNKNKCKMIYKNKIYPLKEYIQIEEYKREEEIKIKLLSKINYNKSCMFKDCKYLLNFKCNNIQKNDDKESNYIGKDNNNNINVPEREKLLISTNVKTNISEYSLDPFQNPILFLTSSISTLSSHFYEDETYNSEMAFLYNEIQETKYEYIIINEMFYNCPLLKSINSISDLEGKIIINMNKMFFNCRSLESLPDISKWKTYHVTDMSGFFFNCSRLSSIPDISNWNTNNVRDLNSLFFNCSRLLSIPDISKWNTSNVTNMSKILISVKCFLIAHL